MKFSAVLAFAATAAASGFTIPNLPDGIYTVHKDANGNWTEPFFWGEVGSTQTLSTLAKRATFPSHWERCTGGDLDGGEEHAAWSGLVDWCDSDPNHRIPAKGSTGTGIAIARAGVS